jgi:RNA polymerase sigma-70 factor (ECF subfamily)
MASRDPEEVHCGAEPTGFTTTHWSVVVAAREGDDVQAGEAMEKLCRSYWYPLYAFLRRQGRSAEDAQDLAQGFFAHLLARDFLRGLSKERGRFRAFLLAALPISSSHCSPSVRSS